LACLQTICSHINNLVKGVLYVRNTTHFMLWNGWKDTVNSCYLWDQNNSLDYQHLYICSHWFASQKNIAANQRTQSSRNSLYVRYLCLRSSMRIANVVLWRRNKPLLVNKCKQWKSFIFMV
jgi:hypothetical protein